MEILPHATTWTNLEDLMLSEISQSQWDNKVSMIVKLTETDSGMVITRDRSREGMGSYWFMETVLVLQDGEFWRLATQWFKGINISYWYFAVPINSKIDPRLLILTFLKLAPRLIIHRPSFSCSRPAVTNFSFPVHEWPWIFYLVAWLDSCNLLMFPVKKDHLKK